jgi:hypothetical protein
MSFNIIPKKYQMGFKKLHDMDIILGITLCETKNKLEYKKIIVNQKGTLCLKI